MKRYHVPFDPKTLEDKVPMNEHPMGSWVKWEDCQELERVVAHLIAHCPRHESLTFHHWMEEAKKLVDVDKVQILC